MLRRMLDCKDEPTRISKIPYDLLIEKVGGYAEDSGGRTTASQTVLRVHEEQEGVKVKSWEPVRESHITGKPCFVDTATAARLLRKCRQRTRGKRPFHFPVDQLFHEYEVTMIDSYMHLEAVGVELRSWLSQRRVDCERLEKRQPALSRLTKQIRLAEA